MEVENSSYESKTEDASAPEAEFPNSLQNCIDNIVIKEGFINCNIKINKIPPDGGNYLACLYEVDITGKTKFGEKEINIFIKNAITLNGSYADFFNVSELYCNECFVYKDLSKMFTKLEDEANVPLEERYRIAKCYDESSSEAIILENLVRRGFKICDRKKIVPLKFMELSVQQLAKFNSFGFIIEKLMPDYYKKKISALPDLMEFGNGWTDLVSKIAKFSMRNMSSDAKKKAEAIAEHFEMYIEYRKDKSSIQTLCHGDFRANNIMMRENEGDVVEVVPVDYQLIHYGCPVNDFLYFVYGCTDPQFRRKHMQHLIDMYYETMSNYLKYFDIEVAEVYPRKEFESALRNRRHFGVIVALAFYAFYYAPEDNPPDLTKDCDSLEIDLDLDIVKRIEDTIDEIDEQFFL